MKVKDFVPYVLPDVMGCPAPLLRQAIVAAAQEFCRTTLAWNEIQDSFPLQDGVAEYDLDFPSQAMVATVREVWCDGTRLQSARLDEIARQLPTWQSAVSNQPVFFNMTTTRGSIRLFPTPGNTSSERVTVHAAYQPVMGATSLPDFLGQFHMEAIASGAKYRLMAMSDKKWSNPTLAAVHQRAFMIGMDDARISEENGRVAASIAVSPRTFGY